jgi:hypothetical protein
MWSLSSQHWLSSLEHLLCLREEDGVQREAASGNIVQSPARPEVGSEKMPYCAV